MTLDQSTRIRLRNLIAQEIKETKKALKNDKQNGNQDGVETLTKVLKIQKESLAALDGEEIGGDYKPFFTWLINEVIKAEPPERLVVPQNKILNELARGMLSGYKVINISKKKYGTTWESSLNIWYNSPQTARKKDTLLTKPLMQGSHTILMIWLAYYYLTGIREVVIPLDDYVKLTGSTSEQAARQNFDIVSSILLSQTIAWIDKKSKGRINIFDSMHMDFKAKSVTLKVTESFAAKCYGDPPITLPPEFSLINARIQPTAKPIMYKLAEHLATNESKAGEFSANGKISVQKLCEYLNLPPYIVNGKKSRRHKEERRDPLEAGLNSSTKIEWSYDREIKKPADFEDAYVCYKLLQ
jgi:hypothetical protein